MELACAPERRGNVKAVAELSRRYPTFFEFSSDQDLSFIARACSLGRGPDAGLGSRAGPRIRALSGGARRPRSECGGQAPGGARSWRKCARSRRHEGTTPSSCTTTRGPRGGSKRCSARLARRPEVAPDFLLFGLVKSAEIFGYDRRAGAGEWVGLFNNTVREAQFKRNFMIRYRDALKEGPAPRMLFKFGSWHMYHGRSPGGAFTIGNLAHELAISAGLDAYGVLLLPGSTNWSELDEWLKPLSALRPARAGDPRRPSCPSPLPAALSTAGGREGPVAAQGRDQRLRRDRHPSRRAGSRVDAHGVSEARELTRSPEAVFTGPHAPACS